MAQQRSGLRKFAPWVVMLLLLLATSACSGGIALEGGIIVRDNYTLKNGEYLSEDQVIIANSIVLAPGSQAQGVITFIGHKVTLSSAIDGDVTVVAERLHLRDGASINGDLTLCASELIQDSGAVVSGTLREECSESDATIGSVVGDAVDAWQDSPLVRGITTLGVALLFGAMAALLTLVVPAPLARVSRSVRRAPLATGIIGLLAFLAFAGLTLIYVLSLVLILPLAMLPLVILGWLILVVLSAFGWIALAEPFGRFVLSLFGIEELPRFLEAALGGFGLAFFIRVWSLFWFTGWIGWLLVGILGSMAFGAVILTRLGRYHYPVGRTSS